LADWENLEGTNVTELHMTDKLGRTIDYLRLSITSKCNLNCAYCKHSSADGGSMLTIEEMKRIVKLFAKCGIRKIRITGGEPLVSDDVFEIIKTCRELDEIQDVALTTNGILLPKMAKELKAAGLDRVNISIDSLNSRKYEQIARADSLNKALEGVDAAIAAGLVPVKINTVLMFDVNDDEIDDFISLAKDRDVQVRFIEYMPMGKEHDGRFISAEEVLSTRPQLKRCEDADGTKLADDVTQKDTDGVETLYQIEGYKGKIGFITPVSSPFCEKCNRVRITADAKIRHCLGDNLETDIRGILKENDETAAELIKAAIALKPEKGFCSGFATNRGMGNIGG